MITLNDIEKENILIVGNSPNSKQHLFQHLIDENFLPIRFKCNNRLYSTKKLGRYLGKKVGLYFKTRKTYMIDNQLIDGKNIRQQFYEKYHSKLTRGLEAILLFLKYYEEKGIDKKIYIHGFSHDTKNITPKWRNDARKFEKVKNRKLRRKRLKKSGTYHIDKLPHNYPIEKMIVTDLVEKGKVMYLTDYYNTLAINGDQK